MTGQEFDPASVGDALDQLVETLSGLRAKLIAAGFNETTAEQICIQQHVIMGSYYLASQRP